MTREEGGRAFAEALAAMLTSEEMAARIGLGLGRLLTWEYVKDWFPTLAAYWLRSAPAMRWWWLQQRPLP
jgi:ribonucleotide reductase alpha subunit